LPIRKKEKEMRIHLKKVLVSLLVIVGFVFYAIYQRYFISQQAIVNNAPPDTVADGNTSETVTTTTVSQAETVSPTNPPEITTGNVIGGDDGEYGDDDEGGGVQQKTQSSSGQTTSSGTPSTTTATTAASTTSSATTSGSTSTTTATTTVVANALYKDGQYDGNAADAYYGLVQVRAIIQGGKLTDVVFLSYPNDRNESIKINTYATPILKAEAIKAQSAKVNMVTGATNTSRAFINSLTSALSQAKV
jgi:uncharacterized protein with FMN-binding domain